MADPLGIAVAPGSDSLDPTPDWQLLEPEALTRVQAFSISRGRSSELDRTDAGTASLTIVDRDGSFDPTTGSDMADPMTQAAIRLQNPVTGGWRWLFRGYTDDNPVQMEKRADQSTVQVALVDAFGFFANLTMLPKVPAKFGVTVPTGSEGQIYFPKTGGTAQVRGRLDLALNQAGWPSSLRHIFSGNIGLQEAIYGRHDQLLAVLADAADAEWPGVANHLMSRRGTYVFRGRYARFNPEGYTASGDDDRRAGPAGVGGRLIFWDAGGHDQALADPDVAVIYDLEWTRTRSDIINAALALPLNVEESDVPGQLYEDATSIDQYGWRTGPEMENLLVRQGNTPPGHTAVEECRFYAEYYVENYKQPRTRITRLVFKGRDPNGPFGPAVWRLICGVEIGDVIHVNTQHWAGAGGFDEDYFVEGIHYEATNTGRPDMPDITLELDVSPRAFYTHNPWGTTVDDETGPE